MTFIRENFLLFHNFLILFLRCYHGIESIRSYTRRRGEQPIQRTKKETVHRYGRQSGVPPHHRGLRQPPRR